MSNKISTQGRLVRFICRFLCASWVHVAPRENPQDASCLQNPRIVGTSEMKGCWEISLEQSVPNQVLPPERQANVLVPQPGLPAPYTAFLPAQPHLFRQPTEDPRPERGGTISGLRIRIDLKQTVSFPLADSGQRDIRGGLLRGKKLCLLKDTSKKKTLALSPWLLPE